MTAHRQPASIHLWTGDFESQQLAFAHLLDAADIAGAVLDLDDVEIIPTADADRRLTPYQIGKIPENLAATIVLLATQPETPAPFTETEHLRYLGCRDGGVLRATGRWV